MRKTIIHLCTQEEYDKASKKPNRELWAFKINSPATRGLAWGGNAVPLCRSAAVYNYSFTSQQMSKVPLFDNERMCKKCIKHKDFPLLMLSTV